VNELFDDAKAVAVWLGGFVLGVFYWIFARHLRQFDELKKNAMTKEEFREALNEIREERRMNHAQNSAKLDLALEKLDTYELRNSSSRHESNNILNSHFMNLRLDLQEIKTAIRQERKDN
jgi:hypothetical protein